MIEEIKAILSDNLKYIIAAFVAYALDTFTGLFRAFLSKDIQSTKLKKGMIKLSLYFSFVVLGGCAELLFPTAHDFKLQIVCIGIFVTDAWSVVENGKDIASIPIVTEFFEKLKNENKQE